MACPSRRPGTGCRGRSAGPRDGWSRLHALDVLARARVDLDLLALLDEERDLDHEAGLELRRLVGTGPRISLHSRVGLGDREDHRRRQVDADRHTLVHRYLGLASLDQETTRGSDEVSGDMDLVVRLEVHEYEVGAVAV